MQKPKAECASSRWVFLLSCCPLHTLEHRFHCDPVHGAEMSVLHGSLPVYLVEVPLHTARRGVKSTLGLVFNIFKQSPLLFKM